MKHRNPVLIRAAILLGERYQSIHHKEQQNYLINTRDFAYALDEYTRVQKRLDRAIALRFHDAADRLRAQLRLILERLEYWTGSRSESGLRQRPYRLPGVGDLQREILALEDEFDDVEFNRRDQRLSITTEPIELEGVALGRFRIDLLIEEMTGINMFRWFRIVALEPNAPACNELVTHPHVDDGYLCPGDASVPIENALRDGRLGDFYMLVRCVLQTYNGDSAYVRLEEWSGRRCADCEYITDSDSLCICESCNRDVCEECIGTCRDCRMRHCEGCLLTSSISDRRYCNECSGRCADCQCECGRKELTEGLCPECFHENHQPHEENHDPGRDGTTTQIIRAEAATSTAAQGRQENAGEGVAAGEAFCQTQ